MRRVLVVLFTSLIAGLMGYAVALSIWGVWIHLENFQKRLEKIEAVPAPSPLPPPVDVRKVPRLWGFEAIGHGCPVRIGDDVHLVTAAHLLGERGRNGWVYWPLTWADGYGHSGEATPNVRSLAADLVMAETKQPLTYIFPLSPRAPLPNEDLYIVGYDWEGEVGQKLYTVKLLEVFGRYMTYKGLGHAGSSGSCVFLRDGTVVGINVGEFSTQGVGVGVTLGSWVTSKGH